MSIHPEAGETHIAMTPKEANVATLKMFAEGLALLQARIDSVVDLLHAQAARGQLHSELLEAVSRDVAQCRTHDHEMKSTLAAMLVLNQLTLNAVTGNPPSTEELDAANEGLENALRRRDTVVNSG